MTKTFPDYTAISLNILKFIVTPHPTINAKLELFDEVLATHDLQYDSVLFVGFSPWCFTDKFKKVFITCLTDEAAEFLHKHNVEFTRLTYDEVLSGEDSYECVVAIDEFTTFAGNEAEQRALVNLISDCTDKLLITTLRDYKNTTFKEKEFSSPDPTYRNSEVKECPAKIITEYHNYNFIPTDRYAWKCKVYELTGDEMMYHGGFTRRAMFFKQLAKFASDAGSTHFLVHKGAMYKSLARRDHEYIIGITFS